MKQDELGFSLVSKRGRKFFGDLKQLKANTKPTDLAWYPYDISGNLWHLARLLSKNSQDIFERIAGLPVADIGAADGDFAFFLEYLGFEVDIIDHPSTNHNGMKAARFLKEKLESNVNIYEIDIDKQFTLPRERYGAVFFLGILYHLKNPFYALEHLSEHTKYCFVSTRIARFTGAPGLLIKETPVAYLVSPTELNYDPTNYWIFSEAGLRRLLDRTGWKIIEYVSVGDTATSNVRDSDKDERAFVLLESSKT